MPNAVRNDAWDTTYPGGHVEPDPYRWLEDEAQAMQWVTAQNQATEAYLDALDDRRVLQDRLTSAYHYDKTGCTFASGSGRWRRYHHPRRAAADRQPCLMSSLTADGESQVFLDASELSAEGSPSLGACAFSVSGKLCAYGVSCGGSDWQTIFLRQVGTAENMQDKLEGIGNPGSISWAHDDKGFFYTRFFSDHDLHRAKSSEKDDVTSGHMAVYFHEVGAEQFRDKKIFEMAKEPTRLMSTQISDDGAFLLVTVTKGNSARPADDLVILDGRRLFLSGLQRSVTVTRTPPPGASVDCQASDSLMGIGVSLRVASDGSFVVSQVEKGCGAQLAGLREGDVIVTVAGKEARGLSAEEMVGAIKGLPNTSIDLVLESTRREDMEGASSIGACLPPPPAEIFVAPVAAVLSNHVSVSVSGDSTGDLSCFTLLDGLEGSSEYVTNEGPTIFLRTTYGARRGRLVKIDLPVVWCQKHGFRAGGGGADHPTPTRESAPGQPSMPPKTLLGEGGGEEDGVTEVIHERRHLLAGVARVARKYLVATYLLQGSGACVRRRDRRGVVDGDAKGCWACLGGLLARKKRNRVADPSLLSSETESPAALPPPTAMLDMADVHSQYNACCYNLEIFSLSGAPILRVPLPEFGSISQVCSRPYDSEFFFLWESFTNPPTTFRFDMDTLQCTKLRTDCVANYKPEAEFETRQIFYPSEDGTMVPMFVIARQGHKHTSETLALLSAYGGFGHVETPRFDALQLDFIRSFDAVVCFANIRGGGEYGEEWHVAGSNNDGMPGRLNKQKGIDDFLAAADFLIHERYTSPSKLAISGSSNGGLLVAACANQRPDIFACVVPRVGLMDMLRFHRFTIGHAWVPEYGCADRSEHEFLALRAISPLHNVPPCLSVSGREGCRAARFPAVLALTGIGDTRVVPHHSYKYIAKLQDALEASQTHTHPILLQATDRVGHGAGKSSETVVSEQVGIYAFIAAQTGTRIQRGS